MDFEYSYANTSDTKSLKTWIHRWRDRVRVYADNPNNMKDASVLP